MAEAAEAASLPIRSVYDWVKTKSVASRKQDGVARVRLEEVLSRGRDREARQPKVAALRGQATASLLPPPKPTVRGRSMPANQGVPVEGTSVPPELLAHLIKLFEAGVPLQKIVQQLRLAPAVALEARRLYDVLVAADGQPGLPDRVTHAIAKAEERMDELAYRFAQRENQNDCWRASVTFDLENAIAACKAECEERLQAEAVTARRHEAEFKVSIDQLLGLYLQLTSP